MTVWMDPATGNLMEEKPEARVCQMESLAKPRCRGHLGWWATAIDERMLLCGAHAGWVNTERALLYHVQEKEKPDGG